MKNILKNKKGFTLLEILVTVGIVGVLSAVAVPAYNQYKKGTIETAVESDIGNFQKAYMAFNAVNGTYCADFGRAGIRIRDSRNYLKGGAIGFGDVDTSCGGAPTVPSVQERPETGTCAGYETVAGTVDTIQPDSSTDCTTAPTGGTAGAWTGAPRATIGANCVLDIDQFRMGATTNVSGIAKVWGINEEGKIKDTALAVPSGANTVNCPAVTDDWDDNTVQMTR